MKNDKMKSILEQLVFILAINLLLFYDGMLTTERWSGIFVIAFTLFHAGTFFSLYHTTQTKEYTKPLDELLFYYNFSIYLIFTCILLLKNFLSNNEQLLLNYFLALSFIFITMSFISDARSKYIDYKKYIVKNSLHTIQSKT